MPIKEELEKEATEWVRQKFPLLDLKQSDMSKIYEYEAYLAGAEPREKRIAELEAQIEKMKQDLDRARENANRQEQWEIYSVLNDIYNDNFEVITSVSN